MSATACHSIGSDVFVSRANGATSATLPAGTRRTAAESKNAGTDASVDGNGVRGNRNASATTTAAIESSADHRGRARGMPSSCS